MKVVALAMVLVLAAGCEPGSERAAPDPVTELAVPSPPDTGMHIDHELLVMVNTADALYRVDPDTFEVTLMGRFTFPGGTVDRITDIAMDRGGRMWGVGFEAVYRIDPATLACKKLATHRGLSLNALSIMTSSIIAGREAPDIMIAAEYESPTVYQVDPATGALTPIGALGEGVGSSGDLAWAPGVGAVMVTSGMMGHEVLSRLAPDTFVATPIGAGLPVHKIRGLTLLPHGLLGVSEQGEMLEIDPQTGGSTVRAVHPLMFYGAAIGWEDTVPSQAS